MTNDRKLHSPAHPGVMLREWIPEGMTVVVSAKALQVSRVTLSKVLNGGGNITANLALRLSVWLGTTPEVWLDMQTQFDLWQAKQEARPVITPLQRSTDSRRKA